MTKLFSLSYFIILFTEHYHTVSVPLRSNAASYKIRDLFLLTHVVCSPLV